MKKTIISLIFVALVALALSSCKSHERCPAYGKVDQTEQGERA